MARVSWIGKQLEKCKKKSEATFSQIEDDLWIEADVRYVQAHLTLKLKDFINLQEESKGKDIKSFNIVLIKSFGNNFVSVKKFVHLIEQTTLNYYEGVVENLSNRVPKAPKISEE